MTLRKSAVVLVLALCASPVHAADVAGDVQRLQIDRDRQQADLRLKMQQQQEGALHPPRDALGEQRRGRLEREQVQRQQQMFDTQARGQSVPVDEAASGAMRELQRRRAEQEAIEQAQRFEAERRAD